MLLLHWQGLDLSGLADLNLPTGSVHAVCFDAAGVTVRGPAVDGCALA